MGTSKIWLYPHAYGTVTEIDLGETLSDLQFTPTVDQAISEGMTGIQAITRFSARAAVRVVHERFTSAAVAREMYMVEDHLKAGGVIALAVDNLKAWAGYATTIPTRGDTTIEVANQVWPYRANATMDTGDEVEILSNQPRVFREFREVTGTITGNSLTLSESLRYAYRDEGAIWVLVRERGFWPALRLPKEGRGAALVTHDHRIAYTFDAQLEEAIDVLDAFAGVPEITADTTEVTGSRGESLGTVGSGTRGYGASPGGLGGAIGGGGGGILGPVDDQGIGG